MRLLIAANACPASRALVDSLSCNWMSVDYAAAAADCLELAARYDYDIVLLDLDLSGSGYEVLSGLRRRGGAAPVLALCPTPDADGRTRALQLGADDCMARPLDRAECLARIQAVVRRAKGHARSVIEVGDIQIDIGAKIVAARGRRLQLTRKEYVILELLALRKDRVISRDTIMSQLYGEHDWPDPKVIDVYVSHLRRKMAGAGAWDHIQTLWGRGFCLTAPEGSARAA